MKKLLLKKRNKDFILSKKILKPLFVLILFLSSNLISSQTLPSNFWQCFEKITTTSELQENYPSITLGETRTFVLMNHGVEIPSQENYSFESNIEVNVLDKNAVLTQNVSDFFLIHEAKYKLDQAYFEVVYYYNFSGNYLHHKTAKINFTKINGNWSITNSVVE
jgi:hypothetical protein